VDVTDKNDDDKVEIPMGPILEESEENEDLNLDITVDFGNGDYVDVDISADELQNIKDQLDKILEETGKTYEDVDFVVTRKEDTEDGNDTYTYDITFRVDGEDVDIESLGTEDANKITVTVPELDPGHEYVVEVYNPETGKFEELDEDQYTYTTDENGNPVIEVNTPWYTEIKVTEKILTFTVIFKDDNGDVLKTETVEYGNSATAPTDPYHVGYTFTGWDKKFDNVTEDLTVTATYRINEYTVTFLDYDDKVLKTQTVVHGASATAPEDPTRVGHTFTGWDKKFDNVTGNLTVTATYRANEYTVTFLDHDGSVLYEIPYAYGATITAPKAPYRAGTLDVTYTFIGWSPAFATVTGDAVYTATYTSKNSYADKEGVTAEKDDDSLDITVDNGSDTSEIPFTPVLDEIRNGLSVPLNYTHQFEDGYYLEVIFSESEEDHERLLAAIEAALAAAGLPTDSEVSLYTARTVMTPAEIEAVFGDRFDDVQVNAIYKYDISFKAGDTVLSVEGLENNIHRVNVDYDPDSDSQFKVVTEDEDEVIDSTVTEGGDKGAEVEFPTTHYSSFYVVDYSEIYSVSVADDTIRVSPAKGVKNTNVTVSVTLAEGYELVRLYYVNAAGIETEITGNSFTLTEDVTVKAEIVRKYTVTWIVDGKTTTESYRQGETPTFKGSTDKAPTVQFTYTFKGWDKDIVPVSGDATYTATYTETTRKYTVTWIVDGVSTPETYEYGKMPAFKGSTDKASTVQFTYSFDGWDKTIETVKGDATYTATYTEALREYTVTWIVDGKTTTESYKYGATPTFKGSTDKASTAQYDYTFKGWDKTIETVKGDATYTATYTEAPREYTVTWIVDGKTTTESYKYGATPTFKGSTDKASTAQYDYTFKGWDKTIETVKGDATYTATYTEALREYTVTWIVDGKTTTESYKYGATPTFKGSTDKASTVQFTYTFDGWDKTIETVTGDATYTATYTETARYPEDGDVDVTIDPENENQIDIKGDATADDEGNTDVEIPMGPIFEEAEKNPELNLDITVDFGDGYTADIDVSDEELQKIMEQLDEILKDTDKTLDDVDFYVSREEITTEDGDKTYVYDITFRVDGEDVDLEATPGENKITVNLPEVEEGHEYIVEVWDPTANEGEGGYVELPEDAYTLTVADNGNTTLEVTVPYYTELRVVEKILSFTVTFKDWDDSVWYEAVYEYGTVITLAETPYRQSTLTTSYEFAGWTPELAPVTADAVYTATYTQKPSYPEDGDIDVGKDPEDGSIDVNVNIKDDEEDGKTEVEIPLGPIIPEIENGLDKPINISVNFGSTYYLKADILPEDQAAILETIKGIIEAKGLTNDDVKLIVSRESITVDGNSAYVYDLSFKVGDVLVSVAGKGANTITVNVPLTDGGQAAFEVYVKNMDGELEKLDAQLSTAEKDGFAIVTFSVPCYTQIRVIDVTTIETTPADTEKESEPIVVPDTEPDTTLDTEPDTETETEAETEEPAGCDGSNAWWIILLVVVLLVILALIGFVLYQKGILFKQIQAKLDDAEDESNGSPLFIPLGEELPEDEPEEIHIVHEVSVEEVDQLMSDKTAEHALEESDKLGGTGKLGIINIGVLHDTFEDGDTVNLEVLKEKDMIADSTGRLKVLASGSLDKALTVEADAFSVQAIKMITLTGGHAVKLRVNTDSASQNQKKRKK